MLIFGTSGIRGEIGTDVTGELALSVGRAVVSTGHDHIVLGRDVRESGSMLRDALAAGIVECGGDIVDIDVVATPTFARSVDWLDADAGVMITAPHNPPKDNGIKL